MKPARLALLALALTACKSGPAPAPDSTVADDVSLTLSALPLEAADGAATAAPVNPEDAPKALATLGIISSVSRQMTEASAKALDAWLASQLGGTVSVRTYPDTTSLAEALAAGQVDVAWLTPTAYVLAAQKGAAKPLARLVRGGFTYYRSALFVRKDTTMFKLADLKAHRVIWAPAGSASGRLFPLALLKRLDIDPGTFFSQQLVATDHKDVCQAVLDGRADAGATISDEPAGDAAPIADGCRAAGIDPAKFRVVERSDRIPNDVLVARAGLAPVVETRMKDALLGLDKTAEGKGLLRTIFHADGFAEVTDADFNPIREAQKLVEGAK